VPCSSETAFGRVMAAAIHAPEPTAQRLIRCQEDTLRAPEPSDQQARVDDRCGAVGARLG
jgi:hypothetical protein